MTKVTNTRNTAANNTTATEKPKHYCNILVDGIQIGYMVLDGNDKAIAKAQEDSEYLTRMLNSSRTTAVYRQAGVSSKSEVDFDF